MVSVKLGKTCSPLFRENPFKHQPFEGFGFWPSKRFVIGFKMKIDSQTVSSVKLFIFIQIMDDMMF